MGTSISNTVTDNDLDRNVADLIVKEAKRKAEHYRQHGIRAYIASNLYVYSLFIEQRIIKRWGIEPKVMRLDRTNVSSPLL